ncbi:MAG: shikimate dehydrogenase [Burkholderiaceae bacterium]
MNAPTLDRYAVIGHPIEHSRSPQIHAAFAEQTGQRLSYGRLLAPLDGFAATVADFRAAGGRGLNVTVPFKLEAAALADTLTPRAAAAGAVNTLVFADDGVLGDNTDGVGLVRDLERRLACPLAGRRVLLLGAGGAARGVVLPLLEAGVASIGVFNRSRERARELAAAFDQAAGGRLSALDDCPSSGIDLIVNATSAGLHDAAPAVPPACLAGARLAYDMVYAARPTAFMRAAAQAGCAHASDGLGMLVEQAAESFRLWRGVMPDTAPVYAALRAGIDAGA